MPEEMAEPHDSVHRVPRCCRRVADWVVSVGRLPQVARAVVDRVSTALPRRRAVLVALASLVTAEVLHGVAAAAPARAHWAETRLTAVAAAAVQVARERHHRSRGAVSHTQVAVVAVAVLASLSHPPPEESESLEEAVEVRPMLRTTPPTARPELRVLLGPQTPVAVAVPAATAIHPEVPPQAHPRLIQELVELVARALSSCATRCRRCRRQIWPTLPTTDRHRATTSPRSPR